MPLAQLPTPREAAAIAGAAATLAIVPAICAYAARWPTSQMFGRTRIGSGDPDKIILTFDDGPNGDTTLRLLDLLAAAQVSAAFFLMGSYARQQPEVVRRIAAAGHTIGNHTMTHPHLALASARRTREELAGCSRILEDITGQSVRCMRPPFGSRRPATLRIARQLGLTPVMWNVMGKDWSLTRGDQIASRVLRGVERNKNQGRGSNILLHDGGHTALATDRSATLEAVESILQTADRSRFITLPLTAICES